MSQSGRRSKELAMTLIQKGWLVLTMVKMRVKYYYRLLFSMHLDRKQINDKLSAIDDIILHTQSQDIPKLFESIPLDVFGKLYLDKQCKFSNISAFLPSMPPDADQDHWTGNHGLMLLFQSVAFVESMLSGYRKFANKDIRDAQVLDFGCGWGRLIRLLYKYVPSEKIYGVDPWDKSIENCRKHNVKANLGISEYIPEALPFDRKFDLIFAFSVFTHLSEKTVEASLSTLRKYISDDGLLVITIRPKEFWLFHEKGKMASELLALQEKTGFAFAPHDLPPVNGDITYGDASISPGYLQDHFPQWKMVDILVNVEDPYQRLVFLQPA